MTEFESQKAPVIMTEPPDIEESPQTQYGQGGTEIDMRARREPLEEPDLTLEVPGFAGATPPALRWGAGEASLVARAWRGGAGGLPGRGLQGGAGGTVPQALRQS